MKKEKQNHFEIHIRPLSEEDDLEKLTELLHRSYKKLADQGFRFLATHQDLKTTKERIEKGICIVAEGNNEIIGTVTYYSPENSSGNELYDKKTVATYGQFAVDPEFQGSGIGSKLICEVEELAKKDKAEEIAIDTAEGATDLINFYTNKGYKHAGYVKWDVTNYRSVLMSKNLK